MHESRTPLARLPRRATLSVVALGMLTALGVAATQTGSGSLRDQQDASHAMTRAGQNDASLSQANRDFRQAVQTNLQKIATDKQGTLQTSELFVASFDAEHVLGGAPVTGITGGGTSTGSTGSSATGETKGSQAGLSTTADRQILGVLAVEGTFRRAQQLEAMSRPAGENRALPASATTSGTLSSGSYLVRQGAAPGIVEIVDDSGKVAMSVPLPHQGLRMEHSGGMEHGGMGGAEHSGGNENGQSGSTDRSGSNDEYGSANEYGSTGAAGSPSWSQTIKGLLLVLEPGV